jgi:hypothetical protein
MIALAGSTEISYEKTTAWKKNDFFRKAQLT